MATPMFRLLLCLGFASSAFAEDSALHIEQRRSAYELCALEAQTELAKQQLDSMTELFQDGHASVREVALAFANWSRSNSRTMAQAGYVKAIGQHRVSASVPGVLSLQVPGFESDPNLQHFGVVLVPASAGWNAVASFCKQANAHQPQPNYSSSQAWREQLERLRTDDRASVVEASRVELQMHSAVATERANALKQPLVGRIHWIQSSPGKTDIQLIRELRLARLQCEKVSKASEKQDLKLMLAGLRKGPGKKRLSDGFKSRPVSVSSVSLSRDLGLAAESRAGVPGARKTLPAILPTVPTEDEFERAVSTARFRLDKALRVLQQHKTNARAMATETSSLPSASTTAVNEALLDIKKAAVPVAEHEVHLRRAEYRFLIALKNVHHSTGAERFRDWQGELIRILEARAQNEAMIDLAAAKVLYDQERMHALQELYDGGFASWKELTDLRVRLSRSTTTLALLRCSSSLHRKVARQLTIELNTMSDTPEVARSPSRNPSN